MKFRLELGPASLYQFLLILITHWHSWQVTLMAISTWYWTFLVVTVYFFFSQIDKVSCQSTCFSFSTLLFSPVVIASMNWVIVKLSRRCIMFSLYLLIGHLFRHEWGNCLRKVLDLWDLYLVGQLHFSSCGCQSHKWWTELLSLSQIYGILLIIIIEFLLTKVGLIHSGRISFTLITSEACLPPLCCLLWWETGSWSHVHCLSAISCGKALFVVNVYQDIMHKPLVEIFLWVIFIETFQKWISLILSNGNKGRRKMKDPQLKWWAMFYRFLGSTWASLFYGYANIACLYW